GPAGQGQEVHREREDEDVPELFHGSWSCIGGCIGSGAAAPSAAAKKWVICMPISSVSADSRRARSAAHCSRCFSRSFSRILRCLAASARFLLASSACFRRATSFWDKAPA